MGPRDDASADANGHAESLLVSLEALNHLTSPLTIVFGYVQLLQRRIEKGKEPSRDELLQTLALMEGASRTMRAELEALHATLADNRRMVEES